MAGTENFYGGSTYGIKPDFGDPIYPSVIPSNIGLVLDARTANQLKDASTKLNTGAKTIEVQMTFPQVGESIPDSHLEEINRLKKLIGVDITLHGPLVDPTGFQGEGPWDETKRMQAERQIWNAIQRATILSPDKGIPVTLHASNGLPEAETYEYNQDTKKPELKRIAIINERTGQISALAPPRKEYLLEKGEEKGEPAYEELKRINREQWLQEMSAVNRELQNADEVLKNAFGAKRKKTDEGQDIIVYPSEEEKKQELELFNLYKQGKTHDEISKMMKEKFLKPETKEYLKEKMQNFERADIYVRDAFNRFRELYNQAYTSAQLDKKTGKEEMEKLEELRAPIVKAIDSTKGYLSDYNKLSDFTELLNNGIQKLNSIKVPEAYKPLKEWGIEKSAETFGNVAFKAYEEYGDKAPVLSIENPPAGMGFSKAEDLRDMIEKSREIVKQKLIDEKHLDEHDAEKQAEKLIGATWDVGHINMLRKYGYGDEQLKKQAQTIAPFVNKIHLSDNFGFEHTELPMGMGNVPMTDHLNELKKAQKEKFDEIKHIIETGNWYQHFQTSPFAETLSAYGSSIYGMKMAPYWNQAKDTFGAYFAGYGTNPDIHHSTYGAGFSNLPSTFGGQMPGRSSFSGTPME